MRYLKLENHIIPIINVSRVSREYVEGDPGEGEDPDMMYEVVTVHTKDGSEVIVDETFDVVCSLLYNPISA